MRIEPSDPQKCITKGKSEVSSISSQLSPFGINSSSLTPTPNTEQNFDCRNHVKVIQPMSKAGDKLYVCGTNAYNPRDHLLYANNLTLAADALNGIGSAAQAECPFDPDDNSTAVWVERGNPSDAAALYTGTATDFNKADQVVFRTELYNQSSGLKLHEAKRTTKYDSKWLDSQYRFLLSRNLRSFISLR